MNLKTLEEKALELAKKLEITLEDAFKMLVAEAERLIGYDCGAAADTTAAPASAPAADVASAADASAPEPVAQDAAAAADNTTAA